jgi:hypothetical protein
MQVCNLKSAQGGAPVELTLDPLSDAATLRGWNVDALKVVANVGECKPLRISLTVPITPPAASAAAFGEPEYAVMILEGMGTGGVPALPAGGQRYQVVVRAWVKPEAAAVVAPATETKGGTTPQSKGGRRG